MLLTPSITLTNDDLEKSLLMISYFYPPNQAVGGKRIWKMNKYFSDKGYVTTVIAEAPNRIHKETKICLDDSNSKDNVIFTRTINNPFRGSLPRSINPQESMDSIHENRDNIFYLTGRLIYNCLKLPKELMAFPDSKNLWILSAFHAGNALLKRNQFRFIVTSSPPHSCHLVGFLLKKKFNGLHWIADFRDPWVYDSISREFLAIANRRLFKKVIEKADTITVTTKAMLDLFISIAGYDFSHKALVLPNGVELNLFDNVNPKIYAHEKVVFGHLGDLDYEHRNPEPLIQSVKELITNKSISKEDIEIHFWGKSGLWGNKSLKNMISDYGLDDIIFEHDQVSFEEALTIMKGVDVLVLFAENQPIQIPAKTYEYLMSGTPILAFVDVGGATHGLVREFNHVICMSKDEKDKIQKNILYLIKKLSATHDHESHEADPKKGSILSFNHHLEKLRNRMEAYDL
jgi:glycosyltransferase involved in cell wall biosynthesis